MQPYTSFEEFIFNWDYSPHHKVDCCPRETETNLQKDSPRFQKFIGICVMNEEPNKSITLPLNFPRALHKVFSKLRMRRVSLHFIKIQTLAAPKKRSLKSIFNLKAAACDVGPRFIKMSERFSCDTHWRDRLDLLILIWRYYGENIQNSRFSSCIMTEEWSGRELMASSEKSAGEM